MNFLRTVRTLVYKEVLLEINTGQLLGAMLLFALISGIIFSMSFGAGVSVQEYFPGIYWFSQVFSVLLVLNRSIAREKENNCLEIIILAGSSREAVMAARIAANFLFFILLSLLITPVFLLLFDIFPGVVVLYLIPVVLLTQLGLAVTGAIMSFLVSFTRLGSLLLPLLLLPLLVPLILGAVQSVEIIIGGAISGIFWQWLLLIALFDMVYFTVSMWLSPYLLEV